MSKEKEIKASYYFIDVGVVSLFAISSFALGVSKWAGIIGVVWITLLQVGGSVYLNNKR